jgi:arylsulfatase A-like enzyme
MARRKNVIVILTDDLPWDHLSTMPYLASNPEGSWVTFPQATHTTPICGPTRSSMLTGLHATTHGNYNNTVGASQADAGWDPTRMVPPALQASGIYTGLLGKYINGWPWTEHGKPNDYRPPGWSYWRCCGGQPLSYIDFYLTLNGGGKEFFTGSYLIDVEADQAEQFVATAPEPFHLLWASKAPHSSELDYDNFPPAPRHVDAPVTLTRRPNYNEGPETFAAKPAWLRASRPDPLPQSQLDGYDEDHANALRILMSLDEGIERMITALSARGILDDTVIIFAGDNGNYFGEHRLYSKGVPYEEALNLNLRVRWPGHVGGSSDALVSVVDIGPTMLDLAGAHTTWSPEGMSIVPLLDGRLDADTFRDAAFLAREEEDPIQFSGCPSFRGLRTRTHKYIEYRESGAGQVELYDLVADPYELNNLAGLPEHADVQAELAAKLAVIEAQHPSAPG